MTTPTPGGPRRIRAAIIGLGLDGEDEHRRLSTGEHCLIVGGSAETHADLLETALRLDDELERRGRRLADISPAELAEIAWRIDSPELHSIAMRLDRALADAGRSFFDAGADELTELAAEGSL